MVTTKFIARCSFLAMCLVLVACGKKEADKTSSPAPVAVDMAEPGLASGKPLKLHIGIAACDTFLTKYHACYERLPENIQTTMRNGLEKTQIVWQKEAKNPESHEKIASACLALDQSTATSMRAQGCDW